MRVVSTFHPSSSVSCSVKCCLSSDTSTEHLVVAKTDKLEVYSLRPHGLVRECVTDMWGRIVSLRAIRTEDGGRSNLLVMTDHPEPQLIVMSYKLEDGVASLIPEDSQSLADRAARPAEFVNDVQVDPTHKLAIASCFTGKLKVVQLTNGKLEQPFDVSLPELNLLAFTFLYTRSSKKKVTFTLALLHLNHRRQMQLLCRDVNVDEMELSPVHSNLIITTILSDRTFPSLSPSPLLVPVPPYSAGDDEDEEDPELASHRGGVLVLGGRKVMFFENATKEQQETRKDKQRRLGKRLSSTKVEEVAKGKEKEEERENRKVKPRASVKWPWGPITAWCSLDDVCRRLLLGDAHGRLAMLAFDDIKMCLTIIPLGEASSPNSLTYLSSQVLYLGSHFGDSQVLRIHPAAIANVESDTLPIPKGITSVSPSLLALSDKGKEKATDLDDSAGREGRVINTKGTFLEVLQNHDNVAPILDAVLADVDGSGQPQIITCSGSRNTGSLRVIRSEADFQESAKIDGFPGVTDIWPIKAHSGDTVHSHLVVSTLRETLVFSFAGKDTVHHLDASSAGLVTTSPTLAVGNVPRRQTVNNGGRISSMYVDSPLVVQITSEGVQIVEYDSTLGVFNRIGDGWSPTKAGGEFAGREIVAAAINPSQFIVGLSGGRLAAFNLAQDDTLQLLRSRHFPNEICAISCRPLDPIKNYTSTIAVSFWGSNKVALLTLDPTDILGTVCEVTLPTLPRSILLHNFGTGTRTSDPNFHPHLLVGLADGTLVTYAIREKGLHDRKQTSLGNAPASLSVCEVEGRTVVIASGVRANLLFWDRQRVRVSPVSIKNMVRGTTLNTEAFPSCLAVATSSALLVGNVHGIEKMQISTVPLGLDNPRRLAYHAEQAVMGVACTRTSPGRIGEFEETTGSFKLLDAHSFQQLHTFSCDAEEEPSAVLALPGTGSGTSPAFCVGTVFVRPAEREPSRGRILVFSVSTPQEQPGRTLQLLASEEVKGCVYALAQPSEDLVVAAIGTSVILYRIRPADVSELSSLSLEKLSEWNHNYFMTNLVCDGEYILVGDAISSVSVLKWNEDLGRLESIARDYSPLWPVAIESTGNGVIGCNSDCNLFSFSLQRYPQRSALEKDGVYHVNDVVNKIVRGSLSSADVAEKQTVKATHVFFTSTGRIGVIMDLKDDVSLHMIALQRNMAEKISLPGEINHTKLRSPASSRGYSDAEPSVGFLDGDFLETFLTHPHPEDLLDSEIAAQRITELDVAKFQEILVEMQSLH